MKLCVNNEIPTIYDRIIFWVYSVHKFNCELSWWFFGGGEYGLCGYDNARVLHLLIEILKECGLEGIHVEFIEF